MQRTHTQSSGSGSSNNGSDASTPSQRRTAGASTSSPKRSIVSSLIHPAPAKSDPASNTPFLATAIPPPDMHDPALFRPAYGRAAVDAVWRYCTIRGWLTKHSLSAFSRTRKMRYIVLADRMLYAFKTDEPTPFYREFLELSPETNVFVTDRFPGVLYCIAVNRRNKTWHLQCEDAETMKLWLDRLKRTVGWLRSNRGEPSGIVTLKRLSQVPTELDQLLNNATSSSSESITSSLSSPTFSPARRNTLPTATPSIDDIEHCTPWNSTATAPPSQPPPQPQDLYYADQYDEWEPQRTLSAPHPSILPPPQRPPPTTAPPPPPGYH